MANPKPPSKDRRHRLVWLAYGGAVAVFLGICAQFYLPGKGFTYLIAFGDKASAHSLPELRALNHYEMEDSWGYDAQYYAQIAMRPQLGDPEIKAAVDNLPYRARRILFCWTAYALALGDPARALQIYAVQNIACWLVLALFLLRWFPAVSWGNFFRWLGVMFSAGLCFSVRGALVDGPGLLLIAVGVALAEADRPWSSAAVLGVAGLGKETNILAGAALARRDGPAPRAWSRLLLRGAIVVLPLVLWVGCLQLWLGRGESGMRNFTWPFAAYWAKWSATIAAVRAGEPGFVALWNALSLVALTVQGLFFALRRRWEEPWWRVGAAYAVLMVFLGDAVWEGYPGAASRVLLPMILAFNILVPRARGWWMVLLLGNLTLVFSTDTLKPPGGVSFAVKGPHALVVEERNGQPVEARFDGREWFLPERSRWDYWRWSRGSGDIVFHNPHPFALTADIHFELRSNDDRAVIVRAGGRELWRGACDRSLRTSTLRGMRFEPGDTAWRFETDREAQFPNASDPRKVAFQLRNLEIRITGK